MEFLLFGLGMFESFFMYGNLPANVESGIYQIPLVILSYVVASFASYTALALAQQLVSAKNIREKLLFHWGGAFALGAGIWSMHFIGMLSYKMRMAVEYDPQLTILSMLIAVAVAYGVLGIVAREHLTIRKILIGAVLLGFGICGMHYTGMAAMKIDGDLRYIPSIFFLSVIIAIVASGVALWMAFTLARHSSRYHYLFQIGAALIMGAAICGMHYTGMIAALFIPYANCRYDPNQSFDMLALAIASTTSIILGIALAVGIYKRMRTEFQLQSSQNRLRAMIDNALDGLIMIDERGTIESFNPACEKVFGYRAGEVIGKNIKMLVPDPYHSEHDGYIANYVKTGNPKIIGTTGREVSAKRKDGSVFPMDLAISAFQFEGARHFSGIIRDITERKKNEKTEALLAAIVESSDDAIISKTLDGIVTSWNPGAERLFGYSAAEAIGQSVALMIPPDRQEEERKILERVRQGESVQHFETVRITKSGHPIDISLTVSPIHNEKGDIVGASKVARDITERKLAETALNESEKKLQQAQKMEAIGNLTGGMAHDFNNLLGIILGNLDLLLERLQNNVEASQLAQAAVDATLRGADLTRRLLAFARQQPLQPQRVDVNTLVDGITKLLSRMLGEDIEISLNLAANAWSVVVDPVQLEASLTNLATNARDAMPRGGQLMIATSNRHLDADYAIQYPEVVPGDYVVIEVSDSGTGIPPDVINRIFEPFFSTKERDKGTGLGLSMVFGFMKQSGGHVNVYSEIGAGTTFRLYLPRTVGDIAATTETLPISIPAAGGHETILVVEDNDAMRRVVTRQINNLGYRVLEADNGTTALAILMSSDKIDLLFTDIIMPGKINGLDLARVAVKHRPSLKVVLTSGFPETKLNSRGEPPSGTRLLSKPYRKEELARILRETLEGTNGR